MNEWNLINVWSIKLGDSDTHPDCHLRSTLGGFFLSPGRAWPGKSSTATYQLIPREEDNGSNYKFYHFISRLSSSTWNSPLTLEKAMFGFLLLDRFLTDGGVCGLSPPPHPSGLCSAAQYPCTRCRRWRESRGRNTWFILLVNIHTKKIGIKWILASTQIT